MKKWQEYAVLILLLIDRYSKSWALKKLATPLVINNFLSFELAINRGISWGLFHGSSDLGYIIVTVFVAAVLIAIGIWTWRLHREGKDTFAQLLILAGGASNLLDRITRGGVVDFISLSFGDFQFPIFNIADLLIDLGILIFIVQNFGKNESKKSIN